MTGHSTRALALVFSVGLAIWGLACQSEEDSIPSTGRGKGEPSGTGGGSGSSGGDSSNGDSTPDAGRHADASGDAGFDRDACRQDFVETAVDGTVWYYLDCDDQQQSRNECPSNSAADEMILNLRDDETSSYWLNILSYGAWGNKSNTNGEFCRGTNNRDGDVGWRMIGCETIELQTGCGTNETATLDGNELVYDRGSEGEVRMWRRTAMEILQNRETNPVYPGNQCPSLQDTADPACSQE